MTSIPEKKPGPVRECHPEWRIARDRVLLYVRGLNLPPFQGLDLAVESLAKTGPSSTADAMDALLDVLQAHGLDRGLLDKEGKHVASVPPLNRSVMVAEPLDMLPWKTALARFIRRWGRNLFAAEEGKKP